MTDIANTGPVPSTADAQAVRTARLVKGLRGRHSAEWRFRAYGAIAIAIAVLALVWLLYSIISKGYTAFVHTQVELEVFFDDERLGLTEVSEESLLRANFRPLVENALREYFPDVTDRQGRRTMRELVSGASAFALREMVGNDPSILGTTQMVTFIMSDDIDMLRKGNIDRTLPESDRPISDQKVAFYDRLVEAGAVKDSFNWTFLGTGNSREAELAGILGAVAGSFFTMLVTLVLSFPVGVAAAIYLEEFAPKNAFTDLIEVNINNLAAVPSIVFGLLGLAVLLATFGLPRSTPLVGGMVLALMTLPTIIIASRAALKAVPPSIREAALGMGASRVQTVTHHVLPLAMPGILTGTIIGMAQALGETAPLLMIGMVAFIVDIPGGPLDAATALPVQIFLWSDTPERAFVEKTSAAIMVLLFFLVLMNMLAIVLRKRFERRW